MGKIDDVVVNCVVADVSDAVDGVILQLQVSDVVVEYDIQWYNQYTSSILFSWQYLFFCSLYSVEDTIVKI